GSDHDSLGLFQMRPQSGWGTAAELMDPGYQARAFFGGPTGPNGGSPRGLLDIPDWEQMDTGEAAQAVAGSAYPGRYRTYAPVAAALLTCLTSGSGDRANSEAAAGKVPACCRVVFPLPADRWGLPSSFGWRTHPISSERKLHAGT